MQPPDGCVYSTKPSLWLDSTSTEYVVKGPAVEVVAAELVSHLIANRLGILVPPFAIAKSNGADGLWFASKLIKVAFRAIDPQLGHGDANAINQVARVILLDIWLANVDRNIGNLLGRGNEGLGDIEVIAIDFEKARVVTSHYPLVEVNTIAASDLWPQGVLGDYMTGCRIPRDLVEAIQAVPDSEIHNLVTQVSRTVGPSYGWADSTAQAIISRRKNISKLVREVWR